VGDLHQRVIDDDDVVVYRHSRRTQNDGVTHDFVGKFHSAVNDVMEANGMLGNAETDGAGFRGSSPALRFGGINGAAFAGVNRLTVLGGGAGAFFLQVFLGTEAEVRFLLIEQSLGVCSIDVEAVGLPVRAEATAEVGTLVPIEAEPFQVGDELGFKAGFTAVDVRVFDAEDHGAALLAGEEPIEESGTGIADVQMAGRGWCETYADGILRHEKMLTKRKITHRGHGVTQSKSARRKTGLARL